MEQNVSVAGIVNRFFSVVRPLTYLVFNGGSSSATQV